MDPSESTFSYSDERQRALRTCVGMRVLAHPDTKRVGDFALLFEGERPGSLELSRLAPEFRNPSGERTGPLQTGHVSRNPLQIDWSGDRLRMKQVTASIPVEIDGVRLQDEQDFLLRDRTRGLVVLMGRHVALWIGLMEIVETAPVVSGLIGESAVMRKLRHEIHRIADTDVPVLLRGETGVGKEIVASSIHAHSRRSSGSYVAVNVAGIPPTMAASELFGHRRGAFTGATEERAGYFVQASHGTLFLDEIGDITHDVQALLLRAIQHGVIQTLGGGTRQVDVRLIAATDSDLESAVERREFREPLLRRFSYEVWVPPLRERLDDVGLLFFHLLSEHLLEVGDVHRLAPATGRQEPWVPASFVAKLALHAWPGNVRELANVALNFAVRNRERERGEIDPELERLVNRAPPLARAAQLADAMRAEDISDEAIAAAMGAAHFAPQRAAKALGISRAYLYKRLEYCEGVNRAQDLSAQQITAELERSGGEVRAAAAQLQVSMRALVLQMKRLGLKRRTR